MTVLSNSYSAEYGGLAGFVVTTKRGGNQYRGSAFYDFNADELNALTYAQKEVRGRARRPERRLQPAPVGGELRRPHREGEDLLLRELRGLDQGDLRRRPGHGAHRSHAGGRLLRRELQDQGPADRPDFPGQRHPDEPARPLRPADPELRVPAANQGTLSNGFGLYQEYQPYTRNRHRADLRVDHELTSRDTLFVRGSYQDRDPAGITFEAGHGLTNIGVLSRR